MRESTSTIKMAKPNFDGIDDEVPHFFAFHTPHTKAHYGHLEPTVECYCHFVSAYSSKRGFLVRKKSVHRRRENFIISVKN